MTHDVQLGTALLWASAIVASAASGAPDVLTLLVLPSIAAANWTLLLIRSRACSSQAPRAA